MLYAESSTIPVTPPCTMIDMSTTASRVTEAREAANISKAELARRVGVSRAAVWAWESGDSKGLTPENLVKAADALNVEIRWLATGRGPKERRGLDEEQEAWLSLYDQLPQSKRHAAREILDPSGEYTTDDKDMTGS